MSEELISAYDIRGSEHDGLTVECAWNVGKALADWLPLEGRVVVGFAPEKVQMAEGVIEGLRLQGRSVINAGEGERESTKLAISKDKLAGGAWVGYDELQEMTVIELYRDGSKLITNETGLKEIRNLVEAGNFVPAARRGDLIELK